MFKFMTFHPIKNIKQKYYELGRKDGYSDGIIDGNKQTEIVVNLFNQLVSNMEKELTELRLLVANKANAKQENNNYISKSEKELIDEHMLFFKSIFDIVDTKFFSTGLYGYSKSEEIKNLMEYIDYLERSIEVKNTYPETCSLLPKLMVAYRKLYDNKLAVEEAEGLL